MGGETERLRLLSETPPRRTGLHAPSDLSSRRSHSATDGRGAAAACTLRTPMWLALGVVLAVVCVLLVARPFLREPEPLDDRLGEPGQEEEARVALAEERDRALAALKELEFDHRTGKVSDEDYRELVGPLRRRAAETLRALDAERRVPEEEKKVGAGSS